MACHGLVLRLVTLHEACFWCKFVAVNILRDMAKEERHLAVKLCHLPWCRTWPSSNAEKCLLMLFKKRTHGVYGENTSVRVGCLVGGEAVGLEETSKPS